MKLWVTIAGREADVEFHTRDGRLHLEVEGRTLEADFRRLPDGEVYSMLIDGRSYEVRVSPAREGVEVALGGAAVPVEVRHPLEKILRTVERAGGAGRAEVVAAPMPGLVVAVRVKPGETVAAGQAVIVVEAMKMQNELAAVHGGVVSEVLVAERATVSPGQALVRIRPEAS
jgi:biotin carboxyl carrier protein